MAGGKPRNDSGSHSAQVPATPPVQVCLSAVERL